MDLQRTLSSFPSQLTAVLSKRLPNSVEQVRRPVRPLQVQHRLADEQVQALVAAYRSGCSISKLAAEYQLHRTTVLEHLKRAGVERRPHLRKLSDVQVAEAGQLYSAGLSIAATAEWFGVHNRTMRSELVRRGIVIRPRRGWPSPGS